MRFKFSPDELLSLSFLAILIAIVCFSPSNPAAVRLLLIYFALGGAILGLTLYRARNEKATLVFVIHIGFTILLILIIFNSLGDLIPGITSRRFDDVLIRIDYTLWGDHPTVWMERFINPFLTAILQFAYISYYFIPVSLGSVLVAKKRYDEFDMSLFGIILCFYLSYIGYLLVPAVGPRFTLDHLQTVSLQAGPFIKAIQEGLDRLEHNKTDAFPSGHTAVALMSLFYSWKLKKRSFSESCFPWLRRLWSQRCTCGIIM